jgi:hypothetical protein
MLHGFCPLFQALEQIRMGFDQETLGGRKEFAGGHGKVSVVCAHIHNELDIPGSAQSDQIDEVVVARTIVR